MGIEDSVEERGFARTFFTSLGLASGVTGAARKRSRGKGSCQGEKRGKRKHSCQHGKAGRSKKDSSSKSLKAQSSKGKKGNKGKGSKRRNSPAPTRPPTPRPSDVILSPAPSKQFTQLPTSQPTGLPSSMVVEISILPTSISPFPAPSRQPDLTNTPTTEPMVLSPAPVPPAPSVAPTSGPIETTTAPPTFLPTEQPSSVPLSNSPVSIPPSPSPVTIDPTSTPIQSNFNIDIGFSVSVSSIMDEALFRASRNQWERIIVGDLEDMASDQLSTDEPFFFSGCEYPDVIDDLFICSTYTEIDGTASILAFGGPVYIRTTDGLPYTGRITFDSADTSDKKLLQSVITHEMGHVLGIGTLWDNQGVVGTKAEGCPYSGARANAEYTKISGCDVIPTQQDSDTCGHFDENCLDEELMTPNTSGDDLFSQFTVASVEDLGYEVDFSAAPYTFGPDDLGSAPECTCNRRELSILDRPHGQSVHLRKAEKSKPRKLNEKIRLNAVAFGRSVLENSKLKGSQPTRGEGVVFVGDKIISVVVKQGDDVFDVLVKSSDFQ